jgi:hypothetical protein
MAFSDQLLESLKEEHGFVSSDAGESYCEKPVTKKLAVFFEKADADSDGPFVGYRIEMEGNENLRKNLKTELHNVLVNKTSGDINDDGVFAYYPMMVANNAHVEQVIAILAELERRARFAIEK